MAFRYPMLLDVEDRLIVIIGGGNVAVRKALGLLEAGATRIRAVAPRFADPFPEGVQRIAEAYRAEHLQGAALVFAATDSPQVNSAVVRDAHAVNALVCRADSDEDAPGDFSTPAKFVDGPMIITVSAESPALAALVRDGLRERFDPRWSAMAAAMQTLRPRIVSSSTPAALRTAIFRSLATEEALATLEAHGLHGLQRWIVERHPELA